MHIESKINRDYKYFDLNHQDVKKIGNDIRQKLKMIENYRNKRK